MTVKRILEDAVVMGTRLRPAKIVVDDASSSMYVRCTFIWCEFLISASACALNPLFVNCIFEDTCSEVGEVPQLRLDHVAVGCDVHTPAGSYSHSTGGAR